LTNGRVRRRRQDLLEVDRPTKETLFCEVSLLALDDPDIRRGLCPTVVDRLVVGADREHFLGCPLD
jgi:hypothetical protein